MKNVVNIDWSYSGKSDYAVGTGATNAEKLIGWGSCFVIIPFILFAYFTKMVEWNIFQLVVAIFVAFDIGGGMICNSLNSCKRFYNSEEPQKPLMKNHLFFSIMHIHPIIIWAIFLPTKFYLGIIWYAIFLVFAIIILKTTLYLKRPISMLFILVAIMINLYLLPSPVYFEWLIPVLFIKVLYGHLVKEEPYRP